MFIQFVNWTCNFIYQNFILFVIFIIWLQIVILLLIRSDKRYNCHIKDCNESFDTMEELISHLILEHNYTIEEEFITNKTKGGIH
jgi:hypothetical protein